MEEKNEVTPITTEEEGVRLIEDQAYLKHKMREEAFIKAGYLSLRTFEGVHKFRSIRRAIRRGWASLYGDVFSKRPFSNRKDKKGTETYNRKLIYEQYRRKAADEGRLQ